MPPHDPQRLGREEPTQGADARLQEAVKLEVDRSAFFDLDAQPLGVSGQEVRDYPVQLGPVPHDFHGTRIFVAR